MMSAAGLGSLTGRRPSRPAFPVCIAGMVAVMVFGLLQLGPGAIDARALPTIPKEFEARTLATGLTEPTAVAFAPDGRVFVAEKRGVVKVLIPRGGSLAKTVIDISDHVSTVSDRGLLGLAVDSDFARNGYIYLLYTRDAKPDDTYGPKTGRLSRFTIGPGATVVGGEKPILGTAPVGSCPNPGPKLDCLPIDGLSHGVGTVRSGADGTLWVGIGDGVQWGETSTTTARVLDPAVMSGAIIHIDRNGRGLPGHPFCPQVRDLTMNCTKVHAKGFRNPFRFQLLPDGRIVAGDVGFNLWEELDLVRPGASYGWPCFEGSFPQPDYSLLAFCASLPAGSQSAPVFQYPHQGDSGAAIIAGPRLGAKWPAGIAGRTVFADYVSGVLRALDTSRPEDAPVPLASGLVSIVDIEPSPGGGLAFVAQGTGRSQPPAAPAGIIWTLNPAGASQRPWVTPSAEVKGVSVQYRANAVDADTPARMLRYRWTFEDGSTSTLANPLHSYWRNGLHYAKLTVSDGTESSAVGLTVLTGARTPFVRITSPTIASRSTAGTNFTVSGSAVLDGKQLPGRNLSWAIVLHHGSHVHQWAQFNGRIGSFRTAADHDADSWYEAILTAISDFGGISSRSAVLRPATARLTLASNVPGLAIGWAGRSVAAPRETAVGFSSVASVPTKVTAAGREWNFSHWSDGQTEASREFTMPGSATTLTAVFVAGPYLPD